MKVDMTRIKKSDFIVWGLSIIFFIFVLIYVSQTEAYIRGDGAEYILQTISLRNHLSFDIRQSDVEQAISEYGNENALWTSYKHMRRTENGDAYSNHFGMYSLLVIPIKTILMYFGINPIYAFYITNVLLWFLSIVILLKFLNVSNETKMMLLLLLLFNPIFFYLTWTHTEVYIFAFTVIGLVFYYNRQYGRAILFVSIAAMQNLAILPYAMIIGIDYIIELFMQRESSNNRSIKHFISTSWWDVIKYGIFYIPGFIPIGLNLIHFGTYSLVADVAMEDKYLLSKLLAYLFDPNLGIFPFVPIIFILFCIVLSIGFFRFTKDSILNFIGIGGIFFIITRQLQINCGMEAIMRYSVWIIPLMIFFVVLKWEKCFQSIWNKKVCFILCMMQTIIFSLIGGSIVFGNCGYIALEFAPWTKVIIDKYPNLYNPTHGIFYSRCTGKEMYYSDIPIFYCNDEGYIRKILLSKEAEMNYKREWCLVDNFGKIIDFNEFEYVKVDSGDFMYLNVLGDIRFLKMYENINIAVGDPFEISGNGVYGDEGEFSWMSANSTVLLKNEKIAHNGLLLEIMPCTWIKDDIEKEFKLDITINGKYITTISNLNYDEVNVVYLQSDEFKDVIKEDNNYIITLESNSSCELENSTDARKFSYLLRYIGNANLETLNEDIWFYSDSYNVNNFSIQGISEKEEFFSWTNDSNVSMYLKLDNKTNAKNMNCYIELFSVFNNQQNVIIYINEKEVFKDLLKEGNNIEFKFETPQNGLIDMRIELPDAISPYELGMSSDERQLALAIRKVSFQAEE